MAELYFKYGTMGASKTSEAISCIRSYLRTGKKALVVKAIPEEGFTGDPHLVENEVGDRIECITMDELVQMLDVDIAGHYVVVIDDAHFINEMQGQVLLKIAKSLNIAVICYGLATDTRKKLFPGSAWLFAWAENLEVIKTICACRDCVKKASATALYSPVDGTIYKQGNAPSGALLAPVCTDHYLGGKLSFAPIFRGDEI